MHSINISNINQYNEIEYTNKEISLLRDRLNINEKSMNQVQNGLMQIGRIQVKQGQRTNLSVTKKIKNNLRIYPKITLSISKKRLIY